MSNVDPRDAKLVALSVPEPEQLAKARELLGGE